MSVLICLVCVFVVGLEGFPTSYNEFGLELWVDVKNGSDTSCSGTFECPFQSIARARDQIRQVTKKQLTSPIHLTHLLDQIFKWTPRRRSSCEHTRGYI
jgi:hypothetical protein